MTATQLAGDLAYLFGPVNALSAFLVGRRKLAGWVVLVAVQLAMMTFGFLTGNWGFTMNLIMVGVGTYNFVLWHRETRRVREHRRQLAELEEGTPC